MAQMIKDKEVYRLYNYKSEEELEQIIIEHYKIIFGADSIFFPKQKIKAISGIGGIPEGFILSIKERKWYIIEVELASHPLGHILSQISHFQDATENKDTRNKLIQSIYDNINTDIALKDQFNNIKEDKHKLISDIIWKEPLFIIIIDSIQPDLNSACKRLSYKLIKFETYCNERKGMTEHIHSFETVKMTEEKTQRTNEIEYNNKDKIYKHILGGVQTREYRLPILNILIDEGGSASVKKVLSKVNESMKSRFNEVDLAPLKSGVEIRWKNKVMWARMLMVKEGLLKTDSSRGIWEITGKGKEYFKENNKAQ